MLRYGLCSGIVVVDSGVSACVGLSGSKLEAGVRTAGEAVASVRRRRGPLAGEGSGTVGILVEESAVGSLVPSVQGG